MSEHVKLGAIFLGSRILRFLRSSGMSAVASRVILMISASATALFDGSRVLRGIVRILLLHISGQNRFPAKSSGR
ncbi:uncharacterized protein with von Willebrand factor type A (vWA) domain [Paraburkholderia sp. GAS448]